MSRVEERLEEIKEQLKNYDYVDSAVAEKMIVYLLNRVKKLEAVREAAALFRPTDKVFLYCPDDKTTYLLNLSCNMVYGGRCE